MAIVKTRAEVEDGLLGLDGGDLAVIPRVEGSEGSLVLGLVLHLLLNQPIRMEYEKYWPIRS